ncbi:MAG: hypothetical protein RR053_03775 [Evtepia sp.]
MKKTLLCLLLSLFFLVSASATGKTELIKTQTLKNTPISVQATYNGIAGVLHTEMQFYLPAKGERALETHLIDLPVITLGSTFVFDILSGGHTKPFSSVGGEAFPGIEGGSAYIVNEEYSTADDAFEALGFVPLRYSESKNQFVVQNDRVTICDLNQIRIEADAWSDFSAKLSPSFGMYIVLPEEKIHTLDWEKTYSTKELDELLHLPNKEISFVIDQSKPIGKEGVAYRLTASNYTLHEVNSPYALLVYRPKTDVSPFHAQIHFFDIYLASGQSKPYPFLSRYPDLSSSDYRFYWIKFDSDAELRRFQRNAPLDRQNESLITDEAWILSTFPPT